MRKTMRNKIKLHNLGKCGFISQLKTEEKEMGSKNGSIRGN